MRYNLFAGVVFAAAMFLIPLMALNGGIQEQAGTALTSSAPPQAAGCTGDGCADAGI